MIEMNFKNLIYLNKSWLEGGGEGGGVVGVTCSEKGHIFVY